MATTDEEEENEERLGLRCDFAPPEEEIAFFIDLGKDGIFSDFPNTAAAALNRN